MVALRTPPSFTFGPVNLPGKGLAVVFGDPGTGKTVTVAHRICQEAKQRGLSATAIDGRAVVRLARKSKTRFSVALADFDRRVQEAKPGSVWIIDNAEALLHDALAAWRVLVWSNDYLVVVITTRPELGPREFGPTLLRFARHMLVFRYRKKDALRELVDRMLRKTSPDSKPVAKLCAFAGPDSARTEAYELSRDSIQDDRWDSIGIVALEVCAEEPKWFPS